MRWITLTLVAAVLAAWAFDICRKVAIAKRPHGCAVDCVLTGEKYVEAFNSMVYRGSVEDARRLAHHYDLVDSLPGRGSLCTLISGYIGDDIAPHNWSVVRMYSCKGFPADAWVKKIEKVVPDDESWFFVAYLHLAIEVAAGTNTAAILKLQTSLREKGVAESICDVERMAAVLKSEYPNK